MEDLQTILSSHNPKNIHAHEPDPMNKVEAPTDSKIPDLFFDEILIEYKLTRVEVITLMYLYRLTWCKPNLHRKFGIAPILSLSDTCERFNVAMEMLLQTIRKLEAYGFIETIRSGQYFVRKYFTEENDRRYGQTYDNFL